MIPCHHGQRLPPPAVSPSAARHRGSGPSRRCISAHLHLGRPAPRSSTNTTRPPTPSLPAPRCRRPRPQPLVLLHLARRRRRLRRRRRRRPSAPRRHPAQWSSVQPRNVLDPLGELAGGHPDERGDALDVALAELQQLLDEVAVEHLRPQAMHVHGSAGRPRACRHAEGGHMLEQRIEEAVGVARTCIASDVLCSLRKERHAACERPPTPWMTRVSADCTLARKAYSSGGSVAISPSTPLTVPYTSVPVGPPTASDETCIASEPRRKRLMNSPTWYSPTISRRPRSCGHSHAESRNVSGGGPVRARHARGTAARCVRAAVRGARTRACACTRARACVRPCGARAPRRWSRRHSFARRRG